MLPVDNRFYNDFDTDLLGPRSEDYRTPFEQDRDRIIHTFAFRRLQSKTQVFLSGEYDFYRTRLTHSLEVAQIGRSICRYLQHSAEELSSDFYIDPSLVEAACLAHDLGHPPFGHAGERTLNGLMREHGGFEGNAQTLRLLTERIYRQQSGRRGMHPSRAFLDSVLKYKTLYSELDEPENHFIYTAQEQYRDFALGGEPVPEEWTPGEKRDGLRSIECQIMDWADDTAYSINDLVDGITAGFVTGDRIEAWLRDAEGLEEEEIRVAEEVVEIIRGDEVERRLAVKVGAFINACRLEPWENLLSEATNRYRYKLVVAPEVDLQRQVFKRMAVELLFRTPQLNQLEYKGDAMLRRLFEALESNYLESARPAALATESVHRRLTEAPDADVKMRMICDYVADMTDDFAIRSYRRLFDPTYGSLAEIV